MKKNGMSKIGWMFFLVFLELRALSQDIDTSQWILIDCGGTVSFGSTTLLVWNTDESYIKTGTNQNVIINPYLNADSLKTLRSFPNQNKNCYTLPTSAGRYFFRAGFLYGNYDRRARPPTFDLEIDGNKWDTVETSITSAVYREVIYTSKEGNTRICLARTKDDEIPFISTLEAWPINDLRMYKFMNSDVAWLSSYRYNYGATYTIVGYNYVSENLNIIDPYNRIWNPPDQSIPDVTTVSSYNTSLVTTTYEYPPNYAVLDAITADNLTKPIVLSFDLKNPNSLNYIEVYFTELETLSNNENRSIDFYVDDDFLLTITPQFESCSGAIAVVPSNKTVLTVELRPAQNSTLPPIVSAIEVYTASDPLITAGTSQDDLNGLAVLISTFTELQGWTGEPCLPSDTVWEWLACNGSNTPPRVTSIKLSGYGLEGALPDFSSMQDLESIDMSNNRLNGEIPKWLGELPNLKILNLKNNVFSGDTPDSIKKNKNLKFSVGSKDHKSNTTIIIILSVAIPLAIIIIIVALLYFFIRRSKKSKPSQIGPLAENDTNAISMDFEAGPLIIETLPTDNLTGLNDEVALSHETHNNLASNVNVGHNDEESMVPDMDMDEFDEMVSQQGISGSTIANVGTLTVVATPSNSADVKNDVEYSTGKNDVASHVDVVIADDMSMVPDINMDEFDQMLNRQESSATVKKS